MKKIDVHSHYISPMYREYLKKHFDGKADGVETPNYDLNTTLETMEDNDIDFSILSSSSPHINTGEKRYTLELAQEINEFAYSLVNQNREKLSFFASLPIPHVKESCFTVDYWEKIGIAGFTLPTNSRGIYLGNPCLAPILEKLNEHHSIVLIHPNAPANIPAVSEEIPYPILEFFFDTTRTIINMLVNNVFEEYPNIRWIIPHAGAVLPMVVERVQNLTNKLNPTLSDNQVDLKAILKKIYFDLAGYCLPQQLPALTNYSGFDHLLYASDATYTPRNQVKTLATALEETTLISAENKQRLFYSNSFDLLKSKLELPSIKVAVTNS